MQYRILIIDDEPIITSLLEEAFRKDGYECQVAEDGDEGLKIFESFKPQVVVTDLKMPKRSGLQVLKDIKAISPETQVLIMTGYGTEELAIEALRLGASNYVKKPFNLAELRRIVASEFITAETLQSEKRPLDWLREEQFQFVLDNSLESITLVVRYIFRRLTEFTPGLNFEGPELAVRELLINAMEHGNFEITREEKQQYLTDNTYEKILKDRRESPPFSNRKIHLSYYRNSERLLFKIRDEGPGFDWRQFPDPMSEEGLLKKSGRGIFLARIFGDQLSFNEDGNEVTFIKRCDSR